MFFGMPTLIEFGTIEENLALCRELGLDFIELNMNLPLYQTAALRERLDAYRRLSAETGVFFTLHLDENLNFADFNPLVREAYCQTAVEAIRIAKELQMPVLNLHLPQGVYFT
ncbi:MAG: sugar phosphate isomerase/epimerase, partial [Clostridia bacterium]|nr:sugar phosphate isomerase/epimerase [Clostridia bacterium]